MKSVIFKNKSTKFFILGGILLFVLLYIFWVYSWSVQGEGLKKGRLGIDECHQCGMLLSDQRSVISILTKDNLNHDVTHHFDDIGCFLNYASTHREEKWEGLSYDFETLKEIPLTKANFEKGNYHTPMGSGWIIRKEPNSQTKSLIEVLK